MTRPTLADVARAAGISLATASNALNNRRYVDQATKERVVREAARLGYVPNPRARNLRTGGAHGIALISPMPFAIAGGPSRLGFLMEIASVAATFTIEQGMVLLLVPPVDSVRLNLDHLEIDGALLVEPSAEDPTTAHFAQRGVPVVCIGRQPGADIPCVDLQSHATAALLLRHLHEQGARHIALLIGAQARTSHIEAEQAYLELARSQTRPPMICRIDEQGGEAAAQAAVRHLLAERPELDGICAPVDVFAVGAVRALHELGRSIPGDVKLATRYDGILARSCDPPLTAVDLHLPIVAQTACTLLLARLRGETVPVHTALPPPELIPRRSSLAG